jgi:hypothetical protein
MVKLPALLVALMFGWLALVPFASSAQASPVFIDDFSVTKNGVLLFADSFSDGVPPPSAPNFTTGTPASYGVNGALSESGGRVRLETVGATVFPPLLFENARLLTNIDPLNLAAGLKSDDTFSVRGLFDLTVPTYNLEFYGIRLTEGGFTADDIVAIGVQRGSDGVDRVKFQRQPGGSFDNFDLLLDPGHDQILLDLTRASTGSDAITGSFAYVDGGVVGAVTTFGGTIDIFHGENFTRGEFAFFVPISSVPEPSSLLLFGTGLVALAAGSWKRTRRH